VLVEYGPGGYSPGHTHPKSAFIYATVLEMFTKRRLEWAKPLGLAQFENMPS
jgi:hypothetical protein